MKMQPQINADERRFQLDALAQQAIGAAYDVSNCLGVGFLEKVYENALTYELTKRGLKACQQSPVDVVYDGVVVGQYVADILVEDSLLIEAKAVKALDDAHLAQCLNYLKATRLKLCLLINFGHPKVEIKRIVHNF